MAYKMAMARILKAFKSYLKLWSSLATREWL